MYETVFERRIFGSECKRISGSETPHFVEFWPKILKWTRAAPEIELMLYLNIQGNIFLHDKQYKQYNITHKNSFIRKHPCIHCFWM